MTDLVERLERQLSNCSDSYEAPSGKIMLRVWANDMAAVLKLARLAAIQAASIEPTLREAATEALALLKEWSVRDYFDATIAKLSADLNQEQVKP